MKTRRKKPTTKSKKAPRRVVKKVVRYNRNKGMNIGSPFPLTYTTKMYYRSNYNSLITTGGSPTTYFRWKCNDLRDFDFDNVLGDYSSQYYNQLLSLTGPYKRFVVYAWKTTIQVLNFTDVPCDVFVDPGSLFSSTEADAVGEQLIRPGVQTKFITGQNNARPSCQFTVYRKLKNMIGITPAEILSNYAGYYNVSPSSLVYGTCLIRSSDGTSVPQVRARVQHTFYVKLFDRDAPTV